MKDEILIIITKATHVETYQNTILLIKKRLVDIKINTIAKMINITQAHIVQIIQKSSQKNLLNYKTSIASNSGLIKGK